jgi:hypothetical protein
MMVRSLKFDAKRLSSEPFNLPMRCSSGEVLAQLQFACQELSIIDYTTAVD